MVSLNKGQSLSLAKAGGGGLKNVVLGLGWDVRKSRGFFGFGAKKDEIDLDASCIMFDAGGAVVDTVWFQQLKSRCGSIVHTGDNRTGSGDGDDEQIRVDLDAVPATAGTLVFTVNSFQGDTFDRIDGASVRLLNEVTGEEIARYELSGSGSHTAQIMAKLARADQGWTMTALGERANGRTFKDLLPAIQRHV